MVNFTCNSTLDDMRIGSSEVVSIGPLTFHEFGIIVSAACSLIAVLLSFYLIWMHALHYTKPYEQRHIIRILFMVPVYSIATFLSFWFYWHAIYFQVISDCYEAFAIASFFALLCHYVAPNLHEQKEYFRGITPKPWVLPINWLAKMCGGETGPWRTPRSGLTWFNVVWTGIYQYCFIRVSMTVTAVVTQYFGRYCESSDSPVFAHIWILTIEGVAVSIAMYMVIQFYIQLREDLAAHRPFLKVLAIKLVIFLSFWQSFLISILTSSTLNILSASSSISYPDLKVGIPSLLLCIEMAIFAVLHLFAFPWKPYQTSGVGTKYPSSNGDPNRPFNQPGEKQGGFWGFGAFADAMNPWDLVKAFARAMRWLFVGRKTRKNDISYKADVTLQPQDTHYKGTGDLPIANEFRRSGPFGAGDGSISPIRTAQADPEAEEGAGLIAHAQPNPLNASPGKSGYVPARQRYDPDGREYASTSTSDGWGGESVDPDHLPTHPEPGTARRTGKTEQEPYNGEIGMAVSGHEDTPGGWPQKHIQNIQQQTGPYNPSNQTAYAASGDYVPNQNHYTSQPLQSYDQAPYPPPLGTYPQNANMDAQSGQPHHAAHNMLWGSKQ